MTVVVTKSKSISMQKKISKTVDLFSRIKNTDQAEEVLTVIFATKQLKQAKPERALAEKDIYDYILDWKKSWRADEKQRAVARAICTVLLGWVRLNITELLSEPEAV